MRVLPLLLLCGLASLSCRAQFSAELVFASGPFRDIGNQPDEHGFVSEIGINPAYRFGSRWGLLRLEASRATYSGVAIGRRIDELVSAPAFASEPISVSLRTTITGWTSYRLVLASETDDFLFNVKRLKLTCGIGMLTGGHTRATRDVVAHTLDYILLSPEQTATFNLRDGKIIQAPFVSPRYTTASILYSFGFSYTLAERVRIFVGHDSVVRLWGEATLGPQARWRLGIAGTVWTGRRAAEQK